MLLLLQQNKNLPTFGWSESAVGVVYKKCDPCDLHSTHHHKVVYLLIAITNSIYLTLKYKYKNKYETEQKSTISLLF